MDATVMTVQADYSQHIDARLPSKDARYRIHDAASAAAVARLPRGTVVRLDIPSIDPGVAARYEFNINKALNECGCRLSAVFLVVTVCAAAVVDVLEWSFIRQLPVTAIATELSIVFVSAGVGRIIGITVARCSLRKTLSAVFGRSKAQMAKEGSWTV
jgi:hypothetical protein